MKDKRTIVEKILAGEANIIDYDIDSDFNDEELRSLLEADVIRPRDLSDWRASDMVISGMLSYEEYPFENFSNYERIRQLEQEAISREDFKAKADLEYFDGDDWLNLLNVWPELDAEAPWNMIRDETHSNHADWKRLSSQRAEEKNTADWALEKAITDKQNAGIIQLIVEGHKLHRPDILATEEFFSLPLRTASLILRCAMTEELRAEAKTFLAREQPESEVLYLLDDVEKIPAGESNEDEDRLLEAIDCGEDREICRLTQEENIHLQQVTTDILATFVFALMRVKKKTAVVMLSEGFHYASQPLLLTFLLNECHDADELMVVPYKTRLMYTNLLIHILQGEITPADDDLIEQDWYPMGNSVKDGCDRRVYCHSYSYCFDPKHLYEPRDIDGEYEKPEHTIR